MLDFILGLLDRVSLVRQERILVVHRKYLQFLSKILSLYSMVFVLDPEGESRTSGNVAYVNCKPLKKEEQIPKIPQSEISEYDALADLIVAHMSPKVTSHVSIATSTRDESLLVAHRLLKSMKNYKISPHLLLLLDFDYATIKLVDKANLVFLVSDVVSHGKYTILPLSFERVARNSLRMGVVDYVEKCIAELLAQLHEKHLAGTFIPLCFRLEPISLFRDLAHALDLLLFTYAGRVKLHAGDFALGSVDVWSGFKEEVLKMENILSKVRVGFVSGDRLDIKVLVETSLRDVVVEGIDAIAKTASIDEVVEVMASLRHLNMVKV